MVIQNQISKAKCKYTVPASFKAVLVSAADNLDIAVIKSVKT